MLRFHAYTVTTELDVYERSDVDQNNRSTLVQRKKVFGGVPDGAGVRPDVMTLFEELEEAKNNLTQIRTIMKEQQDKLVVGTIVYFT